MKVNNPLEGIRKIGTYNNSNIFYDSDASKDYIIRGNKAFNPSWYIVGIMNIKQAIEAIQKYESK
jgi:hypothetical protein